MLVPEGMDPTEVVVAHTEIRQLPYRYAYAHDFRDSALLLSLWHETAEPAPHPEIDIHMVRAEYERWFEKGPSMLFVGNHIIEVIDADHARGSVYCTAQLDLGDDFVDQSILYRDSYVRNEGTWLFERRRHLLWFGQARTENPLDQKPNGWPRTHTGRGRLPGHPERAGDLVPEARSCGERTD